jgi:peptide/nickel transport system ATP-binding protein
MPTDAEISQDPSLRSLRVDRLSKRYATRSSLWPRGTTVAAAIDVSFAIDAGKTLALVGRSGSGKSTVARCIARLERPDSGEVWLGSTNIAMLEARDLRRFRPVIQMIFQDPVTAMNPRMSAAEIIEEPLLIQKRGTQVERRDRAAELMEEVGLSRDGLDRRITEFSGGQRQRMAIARALTLQPSILLLDEALSNLDLLTQAQISQLLLNLQRSRGITFVFISHDLGFVAQVAERVAIMHAGRVVEQGPTRQILSRPVHDETRLLLAAAMRSHRRLKKARGAWA